jgi:hypothetical protein
VVTGVIATVPCAGRVSAENAVVIPDMGLNFRHPSDAGLGYFSHMRFTWGESVRALGMGVVMFVHGIFPPVFDKYFSAYVKKAQERIDGIRV